MAHRVGRNLSEEPQNTSPSGHGEPELVPTQCDHTWTLGTSAGPARLGVNLMIVRPPAGRVAMTAAAAADHHLPSARFSAVS